MKLIKKIAAIMFAFMMVVSMSCNVKARTDESGEYGQTDGKIVINNAIAENDYTIYRLLKLESYSGENYSYTLEDGWDGFIRGTGADYLTKDENGYITFNSAKNNPADMRLFAEKALAYAKTVNLATDATRTENATSKTVTFDNLPLGYYVVGSTVGSLCELNTTDKVATIKDKNEQPKVEKKIVQTNPDGSEKLGESNSVNIGDSVEFELTFDVKPGATNYIVHDKMDSHLQFMGYLTYIKADSGDNLTTTGENPDYLLKSTGLNDEDCTFEISFTNSFFNKYREKIDNKQLTKITLKYGAFVLDTAPVKTAMNNTAYLTFGDNNTKSNESITTTKTFEMNVFKFYKDKKNSDKETGLAGAVFTLSKNGTNPIKLIDKGSNTYRVAKTDETNTITEVITPDNGRFTIQGLGAGTYYLTETKQPEGYNKLSGPVTVVIDENGKVTVGNDTNPVDEVGVENKTGTVLPSTGGMGTTMIYLIGGALVLGSGVVLVTKRRVKGK